ncbi:MAG TPA: hypothetical protein VFS77_00395, partial [Pyrinomonadaceae bacterium]|nr:hypothetical protein [Pyrinomonadaceae bacterium]
LTISGYPNATISNNTHFQRGNIMTLHGDPSPGFVYKNNLTVRDSRGYGVKGDASGEGTVALAAFTPGAQFVNNVIVGANASLYPGNNSYPSSLSEVGLVNPEGGDFRLSPKSRYRAAGGQSGGQKPAVGCDFDLLPKPSK